MHVDILLLSKQYTQYAQSAYGFVHHMPSFSEKKYICLLPTLSLDALLIDSRAV